MTVTQALVAFTLAAGLLTVTPGLDTAMVLRTSIAEGRRRAALAALGVVAGCLTWGLAVALGLGVLLDASRLGYTLLKWAGAAYLIWLGFRLVTRPRTRFDLAPESVSRSVETNWWLRGLLTNALNPKVGVFYISFLPQFVPTGVAPAPFIVLLAVIHACLGMAWFAVLIGATAPLSGWLARGAVVRWLDRLTGAVFIGFGLKLALDRR